MPRRNTVTPFGNLVTASARGDLMGNRGILHNDKQEIVRPYMGKRWVACTLDRAPGTPRRPLMDLGHYTVLFFLDEATALAAGHRPCATCRRKRYDDFLRSWSAGARSAPGGSAKIDRVDATLHGERVQRGGGKPPQEANIDDLPDGSMIDIDGTAHLIKGRDLLQWSPAGYMAKIERPAGKSVAVLTPASIVNCLKAGYLPAMHNSAETR